MPNWVIVLIAVLWLPTVLGTIRLWMLYARTQAYDGDQWLLQLVCVIATLLTPVVVYISFISTRYLLGFGPLDNVAVYSTLVALLIAVIVPLINVRFELWMRGQLKDPKPPASA